MTNNSKTIGVESVFDYAPAVMSFTALIVVNGLYFFECPCTVGPVLAMVIIGVSFFVMHLNGMMGGTIPARIVGVFWLLLTIIFLAFQIAIVLEKKEIIDLAGC